jgi:hypothetical protein
MKKLKPKNKFPVVSSQKNMTSNKKFATSLKLAAEEILPLNITLEKKMEFHQVITEFFVERSFTLTLVERIEDFPTFENSNHVIEI